MKYFKYISIIGLLSLSLNVFSQMGVTSYSIYSIAINTSQNKRISGELKTFANRPVNNILMELNGFYNFKPRQYHRFSLGIGINISPAKDFDRFYAFTIPLAIEIFPLQEFKKVSLLIEVAPEIYPENDMNLRNLWGIRYTFGK